MAQVPFSQVLKRRELQGTAAPAAGTFYQGEVVWNTAPASAAVLGWVCVADGTPGTWTAFGGGVATGTFTGDGATTAFNIAHNLNITVGVPQIQLRNTTTNEVNPPGGPGYTWVDADTVTATFSTAPAIGVIYEWRAV